MATVDLFMPSDAPPNAPPDVPPAPVKAPGSGLLVTNHLNLFYMLATGLVMPPAGFGGKYYRDPLECCPGWIPVFLDKAPKGAIESATREAEHLKPVIVRIDLSGTSGRLAAIGEHGSRELHFPSGLDGTERVLFVPAPLPVSRIESILFQSAEDKRACERDAKDFGNVPLTDFKRGTNKALFAKAPDTPWPPPPGEGPAGRESPLERPLAAGGVMAMLLLFGNLGNQAIRACRAAFEAEGGAAGPPDGHPILAGLNAWLEEGSEEGDGGRVGPPPAPVPSASASSTPETDRAGLRNAYQARLFREAVERLVRWRDSGRAGSAETVLLDHLHEASTSLDPRAQAGIRRLHGTLESLTGLADASASELFERHDTPLAHALTLFFLRRDCADLFDYRNDRLGEADWLGAAILFGVRDGWLGLPLRLRAHPGLAAAVSHRMARTSLRIAGSGFDLGPAPPRARPLREVLGDGAAWQRAGGQQANAPLELARLRKWDCVSTRISLGTGEYTLTVKGGSVRIDLPGEPRVSSEIDRERFFALLADARLDGETEAKVRAKLPAGLRG